MSSSSSTSGQYVPWRGSVALQEYCLHCYTTNGNLVKVTKSCAECNLAYYCNAACQKRDWSMHHRTECPNMRTICEKGVTFYKEHFGKLLKAAEPAADDWEVVEMSGPMVNSETLLDTTWESAYALSQTAQPLLAPGADFPKKSVKDSVGVEISRDKPSEWVEKFSILQNVMAERMTAKLKLVDAQKVQEKPEPKVEKKKPAHASHPRHGA